MHRNRRFFRLLKKAAVPSVAVSLFAFALYALLPVF